MSVARAVLVLAIASGSVSCDDHMLGYTPEPALTDAQILTRISLDLLGARPTIAQLDRVERDPEAIDVLIEDFLLDPRFGSRVGDLFSEVYNTRNGNYYVRFDIYRQALYGGIDEAFAVSHIGEEPLKMLGYIADNDLPFTELVTGDWTMADHILAQMWPLDYPEGETGWKRVHYTDERPKVGVLATNSMWWHTGSMENNLNRGRANKVSTVFLCSNFLDREVPFSNDTILSNNDALGDAIQTDPGCYTCHVDLDPLASHFYGYWWFFQDKSVPEQISVYHPSREHLWQSLTGVAPGYFGKPSSGLADLGRLIAEDPRYTECFVEHVWELTTRTNVDQVQIDLTDIHESFTDDGLKIRSVFREMVKHPAYRGEDARFETRLVTPELLSSQITDLTGYTWTSFGRNLMNTQGGYSLLAGGVDGDKVITPAIRPTVTMALVQERLAEQAAAYVIEHDRNNPKQPLLLTHIDFTETPDTNREAMVVQIQQLHRRILGRKVLENGLEVEANLALWSELYALETDPAQAWQGLVTVLLRDPDLLLY